MDLLRSDIRLFLFNGQTGELDYLQEQTFHVHISSMRILVSIFRGSYL